MTKGIFIAIRIIFDVPSHSLAKSPLCKHRWRVPIWLWRNETLLGWHRGELGVDSAHHVWPAVIAKTHFAKCCLGKQLAKLCVCGHVPTGWKLFAISALNHKQWWQAPVNFEKTTASYCFLDVLTHRETCDHYQPTDWISQVPVTKIVIFVFVLWTCKGLWETIKRSQNGRMDKHFHFASGGLILCRQNGCRCSLEKCRGGSGSG